MKTKPFIFVLVVIVIVGLFFSLTTKRGTDKFAAVSTNPINKTTGASTTKPIIITFTKPVYADSPYDEIKINPQTDGKVTVNGNSVIFTPEGQLKSNTLYRLEIVGASSNNKRLDTYTFSFTTGQQVVSSFEASLPLSTNDYSIDRLENGKIVVVITSAPADKNRAKAMNFLISKGVNASNILVQESASSRE